MGGFGSGRPYQNGKDTTDGYRVLDVRRLQPETLRTPGRAFALNWTRDGKTDASINARTEADRLILSYRQRKHGGEWQAVAYPVRLEWTPCTYGGQRPWFICPINSCGRRVALLYLGGGGVFACRHCCRLVYETQRKNSKDRARLKAQKIRAQMGWTGGIIMPTGAKPKGMHWRTYFQQKMKHDRLALAYMETMLERTNALNMRLSARQGNR